MTAKTRTRTAKKPVPRKTSKARSVSPDDITTTTTAEEPVRKRKFKTKKVRVNSRTANRSGDWKLKDLKGAEYNPRMITDRRLDNMGDSYERFGDLSGIVFNRRSGKLVSGHQRIANIEKRGYPTAVKTNPTKDDHGTVEEGVLAVKTDKGVIRIPMRVVDWEDQKAEMAANVAANAHGGQFDKQKLSKLMADLEVIEGGFEIGLIGLDEVSIRSLPKLPDRPSSSSESSSGSSGSSSRPNSFDSYDESSFDEQLQHCCPKCGFEF